MKLEQYEINVNGTTFYYLRLKRGGQVRILENNDYKIWFVNYRTSPELISGSRCSVYNKHSMGCKTYYYPDYFCCYKPETDMPMIEDAFKTFVEEEQIGDKDIHYLGE